jgi:hypothetical protein
MAYVSQKGRDHLSKNDRNDKGVVVQSIVPMITNLSCIGLNHTTESLARQMIQNGKVLMFNFKRNN